MGIGIHVGDRNVKAFLHRLATEPIVEDHDPAPQLGDEEPAENCHTELVQFLQWVKGGGSNLGQSGDDADLDQLIVGERDVAEETKHCIVDGSLSCEIHAHGGRVDRGRSAHLDGFLALLLGLSCEG